MRIYVGNLSYDVTEDELRQEFSAFGKVTTVNIMTDRETGRAKGFAFIDMEVKSEAEAAIAGLNGKTIKTRALTVNEARPRPQGGARPYHDAGSKGSYGDKRSGGYGGSGRGGYGGRSGYGGGQGGYGGGRGGNSRDRGSDKY